MSLQQVGRRASTVRITKLIRCSNPSTPPSGAAPAASSLPSLANTEKLHSIREATDELSDLNRDAVINILELREEISNHPDLLRFVKDYFKNSLEVLSFFSALKGCLCKARESQAIVDDALQLFQEEGNEGSRENYKLKALEKSKEFKAVWDPFTDEFVKKFRSVCEKQKSMLETLQHRKRVLDEKLGSVKAWRKVWGIIYMAAFAAVLICSVVLAAVSAPPAVISGVKEYISWRWSSHSFRLQLKTVMKTL